MLEKFFRQSISDICYRIRCLKVDGFAPSTFKKIISTLIFIPLYVCFIFLCQIYRKLYGKLQLRTVFCDDQLFLCVLPDMVQKYIYLFGTWEPNVTALIRSRLRPGDTFVDVGAHAGYYSIMASKLVGKSGRVVAIEPSPRLFEMLKCNIALNHRLDNIIIFNKAVADESKNVDLYSGPENNLGMTTVRKRDHFRWEAKVEAKNLAEILSSVDVVKPRLIKIDIEGSEFDMMSAVEPLLDLCNGETELIVEISPEWWPKKEVTFEKIFEPFLGAQYKYHVIKNNYKSWQYLWPDNGHMLYSETKSKNKIRRRKQVDVIFTKGNYGKTGEMIAESSAISL